MATENEERLFSMLIEHARASIHLLALARIACASLPEQEQLDATKKIEEIHGQMDALMNRMKEFRDANR